MTEFADRLAGSLVSAEDALAREFEARLADSSSLAFRVAFSVLRHRQELYGHCPGCRDDR